MFKYLYDVFSYHVVMMAGGSFASLLIDHVTIPLEAWAFLTVTMSNIRGFVKYLRTRVQKLYKRFYSILETTVDINRRASVSRLLMDLWKLSKLCGTVAILAQVNHNRCVLQ